ncbi:MAG: PilZ domain-containing protein [Parashewanella sp.]
MSFEEVKSALIEQLKPLLMEPDFAEMFDLMTEHESSTNRFLLKMELNRLATKCTRVIDLRDRSDSPCEAVEFENQTHMLDTHAKASFEAALSRYRNQYTIGVYEEVIAEHKQRMSGAKVKASEADEKNEYLIPGVVLGTYFNRSEERMNYSIHISASQSGRGEVRGSTIDLSVGGARIRLPAKHPFDTNAPLLIKLLDLNEEYYYEDLHQGIEYQIMDVEPENDICVMRMKRLTGSDDLTQILTNLIRGFKFRYKVDVNEVYTNSLGLGYERHYLPHLRHLPLYINNESKEITHGLLSPDNQSIRSYFNDEKDICQLPKALTHDRIEAYLSEPESAEHQLIYCFTHIVKEHTYYYSATLAELKQHQLQALFFNFGIQKNSWRVFKIDSFAIDHAKSYKTAILPGDDSRYSPLVEQQLARFSHVVNLIDLTDNATKVQYKREQSSANPNQLKIFAQPKLTKNIMKYVSLSFAERRQEPRYAFKTLVSLTQGNQSIDAISHDISTKGMQVTLETPSNFDSSQPTFIGLPKLQSLAGRTTLADLPYKLVKQRRNGKQLHLSAIVGHVPHTGVEFMNRLIIHNQNKLKQLTDTQGNVQELADGLKNLLMRRLPTTPYFIQKTQRSACLSAIGLNSHMNATADIFSTNVNEGMQFDLAPLFANGLFKPTIINELRRLKSFQELEHLDVFIQLAIQSRGQFNLKCVAVSELDSIDKQKAFISQSEELGKFVALRVYFGATGKPDMKYIKQERDYVGIHAAHKAKKLDAILWNTVGVGELLDFTHEVKARLFPSN